MTSPLTTKARDSVFFARKNVYKKFWNVFLLKKSTVSRFRCERTRHNEFVLAFLLPLNFLFRVVFFPPLSLYVFFIACLLGGDCATRFYWRTVLLHLWGRVDREHRQEGGRTRDCRQKEENSLSLGYSPSIYLAGSGHFPK